MKKDHHVCLIIVSYCIANHHKVTSKSRRHEVVQAEVSDIENQLHEEQEATMGQGASKLLCEMFCMLNNAYHLHRPRVSNSESMVWSSIYDRVCSRLLRSSWY
jgi:hypothetical protein